MMKFGHTTPKQYATIPVLSDNYPEPGELIALNPDFLYGSHSSAFATSHINYTAHGIGDGGDCDLIIQRSNGQNRSHCRQELHDTGIQTYLQEPFCELVEHRPEETTLDVLFDEIWDIAAIFNVPNNARALVDNIEDHFDKALELSTTTSVSATADEPNKKILCFLA